MVKRGTYLLRADHERWVISQMLAGLYQEKHHTNMMTRFMRMVGNYRDPTYPLKTPKRVSVCFLHVIYFNIKNVFVS